MSNSKVEQKNGDIQEGKVWFQRKMNIVTLGLTSAAVEELGEVTDIEFPEPGEDVGEGEVIVTIDGNQGRLEVTSPNAGTVEEVNEAAKAEPDTVSDDPLEEGWLVRIQVQDSTEEADQEADKEGDDTAADS